MKTYFRTAGFGRLGMVVLLALLLGRPASPWLLALIFVVWVNLHGGFFFGLMALVSCYFPGVISVWPNFARRF